MVNKATLDSHDAIVIGDGVIGCAVAVELGLNGYRPLVIGDGWVTEYMLSSEFEGCGDVRDVSLGNASAFAWGGLAANYGSGVPGVMLAHYKRSIELHIERYDELKERTRHDWGLGRIVSMSLAKTDDDFKGLEANVAWMLSEGFDAEMIGVDEVYRMEPAIKDGFIGASVSKSQWELDSQKYCLALADEASRLGAKFLSARVEGVLDGDGRVCGVRVRDGEKIVAPLVFAATGPWASGIKGLPDLPIRPVKGEILRIERGGDDLHNRVGYGDRNVGRKSDSLVWVERGGADLHNRVGYGGRNVGRKPDGLVWAGTYEWDRGFDRSTTDEGRDYILSGVSEYLPSLVDGRIRTATACLRPVSIDGIPILGAVGGIDGLYVANGAGKKGVLLSLLMAKMIVGAALRSDDVPVEMSADRFGLS